MRAKVVIIGAGQAGGRAAVALRQKEFQGDIVLIGEETYPPYRRPPLSKTVLQGTAQVEDGYLQSIEGYGEKQIDLKLSTRVAGIDTALQRIELENGDEEIYDHLILATGGVPRPLSLPGVELENVFLFRTAEDALRIRELLSENKKVVIIGGGFIGLEVAASARQVGCDVTVLEAQDDLLSRSLPEAAAEAVVKVHEKEGVKIKTGVRVHGFKGDGTVKEAQIEIETDEETSIPADIVIIGIGITPATTLAVDAGIKTGNGILTNEFGQTSVENIYAVGDCACAHLPRYDGNIRLESFQNADQQAANAAANILGEESVYDPVPFLWSDQYHRILQTAGFPVMGDQHIQRGTLEEENLVFFSLREGELMGVTGWGKGALIAKDVRFSQMLMQKGKSPTAEQLADPNVATKDLLTS